MKAEFEANGQTVEVDFSSMEQRILNKLTGENKQLMEQYFKELKEQRDTKGGKGVVEAYMPNDNKTRLIEEFHKGANCNPQIIKEQWTVAVPKFASKELAAHLRDYVWVTDVVKGQKGETVNIPVVHDVEFQHVTVKGAFAGVASLINVYTTTLHEAGTYYDAYYGDIEKIDSNMLDEINRVFAHAAVRAEDWDLIALLNSQCTTGSVNSRGGETITAPVAPFFAGTTCDTMDVDLVADALTILMKRGKDIHPGECVLIMNATLYGVLLKAIIASTPGMTARPDIYDQGLIESILGVKILVAGRSTTSHAFSVGTGTSYCAAYLLRPKRALALAPKRDILIETDKLIKDRQLRIAASHTFGVKDLDMSEVCPIISCSSKHVSGD